MEAHFWRLEHLSDQRLLERLQGVLRAQRIALAELVAHLGEVEERRLHLQAACSSLFSYCVQRLGMSEDEACRRIELARLARRFPVLFAELASGSITLSVALLLKRVLSADNHLELIAAVRGASARRASEILAARFPSPDVASWIRKLPERQCAMRPSAAATLPAPACVSAPSVPVPLESVSVASPTVAAPLFQPASAAATAVVAMAPPAEPLPASPAARLAALSPPPCNSQRPQQRIEPLSAGRYRVQFTADASLKRKLEQARDLLRHAQPNGDFGAIVSRALDSLLDELMRRRFGTRKERATERATNRATNRAPHGTPPTATTPAVTTSALAAPATPTATASTTAASTTTAATAATVAATTTAAAAARPVTPTMASPTPLAVEPAPRTAALGDEQRSHSRIGRSARRTVLERDGLGCSWIDAEGQRCGSTAWLEVDHRHPAGKGGGTEPDNLRLLCRAHNRFAAERAYGRAHIERAIRERRRHSKAPTAPA